jgi:hypothetical protein
MYGRHFLLLHHHSGGSNGNAGGETSLANSEDGASIYFGGQSSIEDTTTTSDSLNADLEVCGILGTDVCFQSQADHSSCTECFVILFWYIMLSHVHVLWYRKTAFSQLLCITKES